MIYKKHTVYTVGDTRQIKEGSVVFINRVL